MCLTLVTLLALSAGQPDEAVPGVWRDQYTAAPFGQPMQPRARRETIAHPVEALRRNESVIGTPLTLGDRVFAQGLGAHAPCEIQVHAPSPIVRFRAWVGVDNNARTGGERGSVVFVVKDAAKELFRSPLLTSGDAPVRVDLPVPGSMALVLQVEDGGDGPGWDHADWASAEMELEDGKVMLLSDLGTGRAPLQEGVFPFSFLMDGVPAAAQLAAWTYSLEEEGLTARHRWHDGATGLAVVWEVTTHRDFPAADWTLYFENAGDAESPILSDIQVVDMPLTSPLVDRGSYRLHSIKGGVPNPTMFRPSEVLLGDGDTADLSAGNGRSSTRHTPFFKVETGEGTLVAGIEWSGNWSASFAVGEGELRLRAGMETTHFRLHPGEGVRMPRVLMLFWEGGQEEAGAQFRQLVHRHYVAKRKGHEALPLAFCNTCFTRGGGWLNETTAENQISLIRAYARIGLEALITDAGWFEGGWPDGAGNWTPRKDSYPDGMGPVAAAAKAEGMTYGLWFEPERVINGTQIHREHPEWCLDAGNPDNHTLLLNFGLPEVQDHFFNIVKGFMDLPGFEFYRQDFNMNPLPYWRANDAEDRQGITEIRYIEGLYAYWDRVRATWPECIMEECASGGHRIDLGTVMRMDIHQKSDYWFDDEADLLSLWAVSQYLPNNTIVAHLRELDDYAFHANLASSLCLGWIADAEGFDSARGKELLDRYHAVKHLLVGAWYPVLPLPADRYAEDETGGQLALWHAHQRGERIATSTEWVGSQYHRPDLEEGMLLLFRRPGSPYSTVQVRLRALDGEATYRLTDQVSGREETVDGAALMAGYQVTIPEARGSALLVYARVP